MKTRAYSHTKAPSTLTAVTDEIVISPPAAFHNSFCHNLFFLIWSVLSRHKSQSPLLSHLKEPERRHLSLLLANRIPLRPFRALKERPRTSPPPANTHATSPIIGMLKLNIILVVFYQRGYLGIKKELSKYRSYPYSDIDCGAI